MLPRAVRDGQASISVLTALFQLENKISYKTANKLI